MKKWLILVSVMLLFAGIQSLRAEDATTDGSVCSRGRVIFGKLTCSTTGNSENINDAYFFGATTLEEIQKNFPERLEKFRAKCESKLHSRRPASVGVSLSSDMLQLRVDSVDTCAGKRGYAQPCVTHQDCLENFCHPERGVCSTVFTVPITATQ